MLTLHDITLFKSPTGMEGFEKWLLTAGASPVTVENYTRAVESWLGILADTSTRPNLAWQQWDIGSASKRMAGFACRRFAEWVEEMTGEVLDLGIPKRLPAASSPQPKPISDEEFRGLLLAAKRILPTETGYSIRVWLQLLEALGLRRSESEVQWSAINWTKKSVIVTGKTGARELPLSEKMLRRLAWLRRRNWSFPWLGARDQELRGRVLYNIFKRVCVAAGAPELHPHLLRHRRLTALCRSRLGTNQLLVLSFSGHAHLSSLQHYYAVSVEEKRSLLTD